MSPLGLRAYDSDDHPLLLYLCSTRNAMRLVDSVMLFPLMLRRFRRKVECIFRFVACPPVRRLCNLCLFFILGSRGF